MAVLREVKHRGFLQPGQMVCLHRQLINHALQHCAYIRLRDALFL
jgi:hypothetical protein